MYNQSQYNRFIDLNTSLTDKQNDFKDGLSFLNIHKDLDYSISSDTTLDSRVLKVCQEAENNFLENQRAIKEIQKLKSTDFKFKFSANRNDENSFKIINHREFVPSHRLSGNSDFSPLVTFSNSNNTNRDSPGKRKLEEKEIFEKHYKGKIVNFDKYFNNINKVESYNIVAPKISGRSASSAKILNTNSDKNAINDISNNSSTISKKYNIPIKHKHLKSGKKCIACELKKKIQNGREDIEHFQHLKYKINYDINKVLLEAKTQMKKLNFKKAYEMLKLPITQGLSHADIYYLFGEVCRVLKKLEEGETYLLECLKFEHHSPFVYYSLGLLYQEILQHKYSKCFFKHFVGLLSTPDGHYQLAKSYMALNKTLKSAIHITKAIDLNKNSYEYYKFRGDLYQVMGFNELALEDFEFAKGLR